MKKIFNIVIILILLIFSINKLYAQQTQDCIKYNHVWKAAFQKYFNSNDMEKKVKNLKQGLDDISVEYIDKYMENSKYWDKCLNQCKGYDETNLWTEYDKKLFEKYAKMQPPKIYKFKPYIYNSIYGLRDLPLDVFQQIDGKDIIDIGAWPGDTTYMFHRYFPTSNIYAYEPVYKNYKEVVSFINEVEKSELHLIHPIQKGLGDHKYVTTIEFLHRDDYAQIEKLDDEYPLIGNDNLGLIKMDTEGYESAIIKGAKNVIKKYKPILVIAIYHTPEDFFEMKDKLKKLNPQYRFMIRRSEDALPDSDLVLIAY